MTEFEKLAFDYDQFEYDFDTYGYNDAVDNRENGLALARKALADPEFREQIIERLVDIAEEYEGLHRESTGTGGQSKENSVIGTNNPAQRGIEYGLSFTGSDGIGGLSDAT